MTHVTLVCGVTAILLVAACLVATAFIRGRHPAPDLYDDMWEP